MAGQIGLDPPTMKLIPNSKPLKQIKQTWFNIEQVQSVLKTSISNTLANIVYLKTVPEFEKLYVKTEVSEFELNLNWIRIFSYRLACKNCSRHGTQKCVWFVQMS